uniref:UspA domain-containing protein n=1 Tax=Aegilops tauschii TaxID=37682 RepID=N1QWK6_AEGTA
MASIELGRGGASGSGNGIGIGRGGLAGTTSKKRLVMIIADPGRESTAAMDWALSHAVVEGDDILLLHARSSGSQLAVFLGGGGSADGEFMETMRAACKARHPRARVHAERVEPATEGREAKAQTILAESQRRGVELLVIGHHRFSAFLRLRSASGTSRPRHDSTAEFLIEHSKCLCVSVQKKGKNAGYLLNTKTHKNFWQLA